MVGTWRVIEVPCRSGKLGAGCKATESLPSAPRPWAFRLSLAIRQGSDGGQGNPQAPEEDGTPLSIAWHGGTWGLEGSHESMTPDVV